jgi:signal transduction histidine kinase
MTVSFKTNFHEMETWREWLPEELLHRALLNTLHEGVFILRGTNGAVIFANQKAGDITGVEHVQMAGQHLSAVLGPLVKEDGSTLPVHDFPALAALRNGTAGQPVVLGFKNVRGRITWVNVQTSFLSDQSPALAGLVSVTLTDVTAHREAIRMAQAIVAGQDLERDEIARELQDNVNQILSSVSVMLSAAQSNPDDQVFMVQKASEYLQSAIQEVRKLSRSLSTAVINEVGLLGPVEDLIKQMREVQPMTVAFECAPSLEAGLSGDVQLMLYRIIQEQTNNILRYAQATQVQIKIIKTASQLTLTIQDNGKGFTPGKQAKGLGMMNMLNRAESFGGTMQVIAQPGKGCRIVVKVPMVF